MAKQSLMSRVAGVFGLGDPPSLDAIRAEREAAQDAADRAELARRQSAHEQARATAEARERALGELAALRERVGWAVVSGELEEHVGPLAVGFRELGELVTALDTAAARIVSENERARALAAELGEPAVAAVTVGMARAVVLDALSRELGNAAPSLALLTNWLTIIDGGEERARRVIALFEATDAVETSRAEHARRLLESGDPRIVTREEQFRKREQTKYLREHNEERERRHMEKFEREQRGGVLQ